MNSRSTRSQLHGYGAKHCAKFISKDAPDGDRRSSGWQYNLGHRIKEQRQPRIQEPESGDCGVMKEANIKLQEPPNP